jgi:hypothetical protein
LPQGSPANLKPPIDSSFPILAQPRPAHSEDQVRPATGPLGSAGARAAIFLHHALDRVALSSRNFTSGLCLGLLSDEALGRCCALAYERRSEYRSTSYNESGLQVWERSFVERYLRPGARVLVSSAGGGREVLALHREGFPVVAFECHPLLAAWGNDFLRSRGVPVEILAAHPDRCPPGLPDRDAVVVGWASYSHIRPSSSRILFLRELRGLLREGAPLLVSFLERGGGEELKASRLANRLRRPLGRAPLEPGDVFGPPPLHLFNLAEIEAEMGAAGFRTDLYLSEGTYPHAVGIAVQ